MSPRTRQLLLLFGVVALVAVAGCADGLGGPDNNVEEEGGELEETPQPDDAADDPEEEGETNESDGETANDSDGETANESDGDDDSAVVINDSGDDADDSASDDAATDDDGAGSDDSGSESGDDGATSDDGTDSDDSAGSDSGDNGQADDGQSDDGGSGDDGQAGDGTDDDADDGQADDGADDDGQSDDGADDEPTEPDQSLLTLTVVDENGEPIEGVDVYGLGEEHEADIPLVFEGETDEDGQYTDVIYENEYTVDLDHEAYNATTFEHTHDGELEVTATLEADGEETGELEFEVLETQWGGGAEGVVIEGEREEPDEDGEPITFTTEADSGGMASVDVPYGTYDVEIGGGGYESTEGQVEHRDYSDDEIEPVPELFEVNPIPPEYDLTVTVVNEDGEPIDGVDIEGISQPIYAEQNDTFEVTGVNGSTTITTLGESTVTLDVTPTETDHEPETVERSLRQDEEITVELESSEDD